MITADIRTDDGTQLAEIRIIKIDQADYGKYAHYTVQISVERCGAVGVYQRRIISFPRREINVLGLLTAALNQLDPEQLELENAPVSESDLARRFTGTMREIQARTS